MRLILALPLLALVLACTTGDNNAATTQSTTPQTRLESPQQALAASGNQPFQVTAVADFDEPWAMAFVPGTPYALITEKPGALKLWQPDGPIRNVAGVPEVAYGGQGGFGDVVLHPDYARNKLVYLSWAEPGEGGTAGSAVGRARLDLQAEQPSLQGLQVIWRQQPKVDGNNHFSQRLAFSPDGRYLFITSGERFKFTVAQDLNQNLGKVIRLTPEGGIPSDNPFFDRGQIASQVWSYGHRNVLGLAFDGAGRLWAAEMGPRGGDEFNRIERGSNYGWPSVSNGQHYDGSPIPAHSTRPEFNAPEVSWNPVISPSSLVLYTGDAFPTWRGSALIGGLSSQALIRVAIDGTRARETERWDMGARIREVEQGPDGALWLLEDEREGSQGRLLRLSPVQ
jgi:glucose/arabinose dehydrogenase